MVVFIRIPGYPGLKPSSDQLKQKRRFCLFLSIKQTSVTYRIQGKIVPLRPPRNWEQVLEGCPCPQSVCSHFCFSPFASFIFSDISPRWKAGPPGVLVSYPCFFLTKERREKRGGHSHHCLCCTLLPIPTPTRPRPQTSLERIQACASLCSQNAAGPYKFGEGAVSQKKGRVLFRQMTLGLPHLARGKETLGPKDQLDLVMSTHVPKTTSSRCSQKMFEYF